MYDFSDILKVSVRILKENENCRFLIGDVEFVLRFYTGFTKRPNYYSGILKENVYFVRNTCNLPETFYKGFLLIFFFLPGESYAACISRQTAAEKNF